MIPSIWTGMYHEIALDESLRALHGLGWRVFEIASEHLVAIETGESPDKMIEEAQACARELNLSMPQAHALLQADVAETDAADRERTVSRLVRHIGISAQFRVRQVVIHPGGVKSFSGERKKETLKLNREAFRRLGDHAGEHNIRIGLENMHSPGFITARDMADLLEAIDHPALGVVLDTSHANMRGVDIPEMIRAFGSHLIGTHISDNHGAGDQHLTPGWGAIDWPRVVRTLGDIGYDGVFNLEIPGERHRLPEFRRMRTRVAREVAEWLVGLARSR